MTEDGVRETEDDLVRLADTDGAALLTPAQARYFARKLYRLARRCERRTAERA